jgi:hypothetical protein
MTVIHLRKTPASAMNPDRPVSSLLKNQILHLQEAEFRLPANLQTNIYINKIKTEREASEYIRQVTARLHPEGVARASARKAGGKVVPRIAAAAASRRANKAKPKSKKAAKTKRKKR